MASRPQQEIEVERLKDANELAYADVGIAPRSSAEMVCRDSTEARARSDWLRPRARRARATSIPTSVRVMTLMFVRAPRIGRGDYYMRQQHG